MIEFAQKLREESERKVERIESQEHDILKRSLEASHVLGEAFDRMKSFIVAYTFRDQQEEITFFKKLKPELFSLLIYYRKVYNIEMNRPVSDIETQRIYYVRKLETIDEYNRKILDFYRYFRSGCTHCDESYFLRGKPDIEQYLDTFYYERDPMFSTNCDFKVAKILANDKLQGYLFAQIAKLENSSGDSGGSDLPKVKLTWTGSKAELIELLYALITERCISNGTPTIKQVVDYAERVLNIDLGNVYVAFCEMCIRNNQTPFLEKLTKGLKERMNNENVKTKKK